MGFITLRTRYVMILVLSTACWGSSASASKYALHGFTPLTLLTAELAVAAVLLWTIALLGQGAAPRARLMPRSSYALLGFFEPGLAYAGLTFGLAYTSAVNGSLLGGLEAPCAVLLAVVVLRERLSVQGALAVLVSIAGAVAVNGINPSIRASAGDLLVIGGVLAAAVYVTLAARLPDDIDPVVLTAWQFTFGLLFTVPFLAWRWSIHADRLPLQATWREWLAVGVAGGIGFAVSFLLYNSVVAKLSAATSGMMLNLIPLFGLLIAVFILGEKITVAQIIGGILIVGAVGVFLRESPHAENSGEGRTEADGRVSSEASQV